MAWGMEDRSEAMLLPTRWKRRPPRLPRSPHPLTRSAFRLHVGTPGTHQPAQMWTPGHFCLRWFLGQEQCDKN